MKKGLLVAVLFFCLTSLLSAQEVAIPDMRFLYALIDEGVDVNGDSIITTGEAGLITFLDVSQKEITDLSGLEAFVNLDTLYCHYNRITTLDLSTLTGLQNLNCGFNNLTGLVLSANTQLLELDCQNNQLDSLDVTMCPDLHSLYCFLNHLTFLNVSGNTALNVLECYNNSLTELDVSSNTGLEELACVSNQLSSLVITGNQGLRYLNCADNHLSELDLATNNSLQFLHCEQNFLEQLDVSFCSGLLALECQGNLLDSLDLTANIALTYLDCRDNLLSALDVSQNSALLFLGCGANQLETLDVSKNSVLKTIDCSNNMLTCLDVSGNTLLTELRCQGNQLNCLDLSEAKLIERLDCSGNQLVSIDLRHFRGCDWFNCISLRNMPTLRQVCLADMSYSFLISLTGSRDAYFTTDCQDIEAPRIVSEDSVYNRDVISVMCNEDATIYLVPDNTERDLEVIKGVALDSLAVSAEVEAALPVGGLDNGNYWLYAADSSANVSDPWSFTLLRVGIDSYDGNGIHVYPVPFAETLHIVLPLDTPAIINIYSLNGILLQRVLTYHSPAALELRHLEGGVYILEAGFSGKKVYRRVVKL